MKATPGGPRYTRQSGWLASLPTRDTVVTLGDMGSTEHGLSKQDQFWDWTKRHFAAVGRGLGLAGLAIGGLCLSALAFEPLVSVVAAGISVYFHFHSGWHDNVTVVVAVLGTALAPLWLLAVLTLSRELANQARALSARWCGVPIADPYQPRPAKHNTNPNAKQSRLSWMLSDRATWRDLLWLPVNGVVGLAMAAAPTMLLVFGLVGLEDRHGGGPFTATTEGQRFLLSLICIAGALWVAPWLVRGYGLMARSLLAPPASAELQQQVRHLAMTRSETLDSGAAEIRRIERDLHDGAQARLVAMGMTLDAAGQLIDDDPKAARALLIEARDSSAKALQELRALVRGVHPPVLADRGLVEAIRALALDTPLRIHLTSDLDRVSRLSAPIESAAYFAVNELVANVSKHAQASQAWIDIRHEEGMLKITVTDDGHGGADPESGTGLKGLERRLAAFDGVLAIGSPPGGPTALTMEIPCVLS
jgi:signal transduction histidine kinase